MEQKVFKAVIPSAALTTFYMNLEPQLCPWTVTWLFVGDFPGQGYLSCHFLQNRKQLHFWHDRIFIFWYIHQDFNALGTTFLLDSNSGNCDPTPPSPKQSLRGGYSHHSLRTEIDPSIKAVLELSFTFLYLFLRVLCLYPVHSVITMLGPMVCETFLVEQFSWKGKTWEMKASLKMAQLKNNVHKSL